MPENEYGPFDTERETMATQAAAVIRAAFDDHPGYGTSVPECLKLMTDECEASGVILGAWDLSFLQGVAWGETADCIRLRGMIHRAYEAGKAAGPDRMVTEWGTRFLDENGGEHMGADFGTGLQAELFARSLAAASDTPDWRGIAVTRQVSPWTRAPEEESTDA